MDGHMGLGGGAWAELTDHQHGLGRSSAPPAMHTHTKTQSYVAGSGRWHHLVLEPGKSMQIKGYTQQV